jgi:hypothetical protein
MLHVPLVHWTPATLPVHFEAQLLLHAPQLLESVDNLTSHPLANCPSQSPYPTEHIAMAHLPLLQLAVPFAALH